MKKILFFLLLLSCGKRQICPNETFWISNNEQIVIGCQKLTYYRENPSCELSAEFENLQNNKIAWELSKTCSKNAPFTALCLLERDDRYGFEGMRLSCQELGIHRVFERVQ